MLNKGLLVLVFMVCAVGFYSCQEKVYLGEPYTNYPDLNKILEDTWDQEEPYNYLKVSLTNAEKDSMQVPSDKMPWDEIDSIFKKANFYTETLDKHYTIDVFVDDSITNTRDVYYKSLEPNDFTQTLHIVSNAEDNTLSNIYFQLKTDGFLDAEKIKVLYIPSELLQIQKEDADGIAVDTYYFPE